MQPYGENILLYKTNCQTCQWFMGMAQKCGILKHFSLSCIDGKEMQFQAMGIKFVPAMILKGTTSPIQGKDATNWLQTQISIINNPQLNQPINQPPPRPPMPTNPNLQQNMPQNVPRPSMPQNQNPQLNQPITQSNGGNMGKENVPSSTQAEKRLPHRMGGTMNATAPPTEIKPQQPKTISTVDVRVPLEYRPAEMSGISDTFAYTNIDDPQPKSFLSPTETCNIFTGKEGDKMSNDELQRRIRDVGKMREGDKKNYEMMIEQENKELVREMNQQQPQANEVGRRR